jgi:hypothetical protein
MAMAFAVGDKVKCVREKSAWGVVDHPDLLPEYGGVYTVREATSSGLRFDEIRYHNDSTFTNSFFRKVVWRIDWSNILAPSGGWAFETIGEPEVESGP